MSLLKDTSKVSLLVNKQQDQSWTEHIQMNVNSIAEHKRALFKQKS